MDADLLIMKLMPSVAHERAHVDLAKGLLFRAARMGIQESEIAGVAAGRYDGKSSSKATQHSYLTLPKKGILTSIKAICLLKRATQHSNLFLPEKCIPIGQQLYFRQDYLSHSIGLELMQLGG
jgi:hypothetical protein